MPTTASTEVSEPSRQVRSGIPGSFGVRPASAARWPPAEQPAMVTKSRSPPNRSTLARAQAIAALTSVHVLRPPVIRRDPVVDRQAHPARWRPDATSGRSPAGCDCRAPRHRRARRSSPARVRRAGPYDARRRAVARGRRRSAPTSGAGYLRCSSARQTGGVRSGAGHSISRSSAGTTPLSAASETARVCSRSLLRTSAMPGVNHDFAVADRMLRRLPGAPDAHRGEAAEWLEVLADDRQRCRRHAQRQHAIRGLGPQQPPRA